MITCMNADTKIHQIKRLLLITSVRNMDIRQLYAWTICFELLVIVKPNVITSHEIMNVHTKIHPTTT